MAIPGTDNNDKLEGTPGSDEINGRLGNDTLLGFRGDDKLEGKGGDDLLRGGAGADTLLGGNGVDTLQGGTGNDELLGGDGNDILRGGKGDDILRGGKDADTFIFGNKFGNDTIVDFSFGEGDTITLSNDFVNSVFGTPFAENLEFSSVEAFNFGISVLNSGNPDTSATAVDGNAIFDFGNGNTITVEGIANQLDFTGGTPSFT